MQAQPQTLLAALLHPHYKKKNKKKTAIYL